MRRSNKTALFDHFIRDGNEPRWNGEAERLGGLEIDDELEFGRLQDRQIGRLRAFQDLPNIVAGLPIRVRDIRAVADQTASNGEFAELINRRQLVLCRKLYDQFASRIEKGIRRHKQSARAHL